MRYITWPFTVGPNGRVVTADEAADGLIEARLACLLSTRPGEHPLAPGFGTPDPTFDGYDAADIRAGVAQFGPAVDIVDVAVDWINDGRQDVTVQWERRDTDID